jgi:hypothetical protein
MLAGDRLDEITAQARPLVAAGRGRELMLVPGWWYVMSAESFLDRMTEMPDLFELAPTIHCPTLFIRCDEESSETCPAERFKSRSEATPLQRIVRTSEVGPTVRIRLAPATSPQTLGPSVISAI